MRLLFLAAIIVSSLPTIAQHSLTVKVTNIKKVEGEVQICLFDHEDNYMKESIICEHINVNSDKLSYTFETIEKGTYAVVIIQDLNGNRSLDTNWMRIPKEPYGFSNNPSTTFGPPAFEEASFEVDQDKEIEVKLK